MASEIPDDACKSCCLAESGIGTVTICPDCGVVQLSLQHVSMRLQTGDFQELVCMLGEAQVNLARLVEDILVSSGQSNATDQFGAASMKLH